MTSPILFALALDGHTREPLADKAAIALCASDALGWVHLDANTAGVDAWIEQNAPYLDKHAAAALIAEETRPRATIIGDGAMVFLRGVNLNEGAAPEDMVSIRMWLDPHRVISAGRRRMRSVEDVAAKITEGHGPDTVGVFLCMMVERLTARNEVFLQSLDEASDTLEEAVTTDPAVHLRARILDTRIKVITFRRFIAPQREAISDLLNSDLSWLTQLDRRRLNEDKDRLTRMIEELDAMRERLQVVREELSSVRAERLNNNIYMLSIVSAIFLPLGFLTGVFGVNLAGMPGVSSPMAFWVFAGGLVVIAAIVLFILRRLRWI
ncbi:zinc transporter ZntB [Pseudogemmobacter sp. W21_MBD1_M6]|uniref:zinc transporter ZntB n=1 Tax=Pseudogemmobacter sp. W21_MBD1_M6 TaxID=3240271 RepID=UPI003F9D820C